MRYRVGERNILYATFENFKWTLVLAIFLGGLSLHVSQALLAHMFEIDMTWGATDKEFEYSNFWMEIPKMLNRVRSLFLSLSLALSLFADDTKFKWSMTFAAVFIIGMIILAVAP